MSNKIHEGRNIKSFREMLSIKQEALATELGEDWTQKKISQLEAKEEVGAEMVQRIAKALNIPEKFITDFNGDTATITINNVHDNTVSENSSMLGGSDNQNNENQYTFNPIEKVVELVDKLTAVYERLLESEREKITIMKAQLDKKQ